MTTVQPSNVTPFPAVAPGHHLAPVAIGAPGPTQQVALVQCPDWCEANHVSNWVNYLEDLDHTGDEFAIHIRSFFNDHRPTHTMTAAVGCDPMSSDSRLRVAHVIVGDDGSVDAYLTPDMADQAADDLVKMAAKIREAARTARLHNAHVAESVAS